MRFSIHVFTVVFLQGSWALSYERQLMGELLQGYSPSARPVKNVSYHPVLIIMGVTNLCNIIIKPKKILNKNFHCFKLLV